MNFKIVKHYLGHAGFPVFLVASAILFSAPACRMPLIADDYIQGYKVLRDHAMMKPGNARNAADFPVVTVMLFDWLRPGVIREAVDLGTLPWWTDGRAQISFWRPLSAATHWLDHQLWPMKSRPMHLHNAVWFAVLILSALAFYRRLDERRWVAGLAALLLALNQENWQSLAWVAARNSLITATFVVLTLWFYHRHVQRARWGWAVSAWLAFALGLLAGEGAFTAAAYLFSYAVFLDERRWTPRLLGLAPFAVIAIVWRLTYHAMDFGTAGSGLYIDAGIEPVRFALNVMEWFPLLALDVVTSPILGKVASLAPQVRPWVWGAGLLGLMALCVAFIPLLRAERRARFLALGLLLALVPACATTIPDDRVTLYAMIGFAPLAAAYLAGVFEGAAWLPTGRVWRRTLQGVGCLFIVLHLLQPLEGQVRRVARLFRSPGTAAQLVAPTLRTQSSRDLIIVNAPDALYLAYLPYYLSHAGYDLPHRLRTLSSGLGDLLVRRTLTNTLELVSSTGSLIPARPQRSDLPDRAPLYHPLYRNAVINTAFRSETHRMAPGAKTVLTGMTVTIDRVDGRGWPTVATFQFDSSVDDARYQWVCWDSRAGCYKPFTPPCPGGEIELPGPFGKDCGTGSNP